MHGPRAWTRLVLALAGASVTACGAGDPPRVVVTRVPAVDAQPADVEQARFDVANAGDHELLLDRAIPACGCRILAPLPAALQSGATAALIVRCRPLGAAHASRALHLWSSDPASPDTTVRVEVDDGPAAEPAALYFGYVAVGTEATREVVLPAGAAPGSPPPADAAFTFAPLAPRPDGRAALRVRFAPRHAGPAMKALDLGPAVQRLLATGVGHGSVLAFPAAVQLRSTGSGAVPVVTIKAVGDAPIEAPRVEYPENLAGELRTVTPGRQFRLALRARGPVSAGAAIRIHTGPADAPVLVVPVDAPGPGAAS